MTFADAQSLIAAHGGRLSGSRAYGQPHPCSDWDYWMPERQVKRLLRVLITHGVEWDSPFLGSVTWWPDDEQVEISYLFPKNAREYFVKAKGQTR